MFEISYNHYITRPKSIKTHLLDKNFDNTPYGWIAQASKFNKQDIEEMETRYNQEAEEREREEYITQQYEKYKGQEVSIDEKGNVEPISYELSNMLSVIDDDELKLALNNLSTVTQDEFIQILDQSFNPDEIEKILKTEIANRRSRGYKLQDVLPPGVKGIKLGETIYTTGEGEGIIDVAKGTLRTDPIANIFNPAKEPSVMESIRLKPLGSSYKEMEGLTPIEGSPEDKLDDALRAYDVYHKNGATGTRLEIYNRRNKALGYLQNAYDALKAVNENDTRLVDIKQKIDFIEGGHVNETVTEGPAEPKEKTEREKEEEQMAAERERRKNTPVADRETLQKEYNKLFVGPAYNKEKINNMMSILRDISMYPAKTGTANIKWKKRKENYKKAADRLIENITADNDLKDLIRGHIEQFNKEIDEIKEKK